MNEVMTETYITTMLHFIPFGFSTWSFTSLNERQKTCGKKDTERKFGRAKEDVNSEWRIFDVAELQQILLRESLACNPIYSSKKTKTLHLLQIYKLLF